MQKKKRGERGDVQPKTKSGDVHLKLRFARVEPPANPRHDVLKKLMKEQRESINRRINESLQAWSSHCYLEMRNQRKLRKKATMNVLESNPEAGHFPEGFGYFLCPEHVYSKGREPELSEFYDAIMTLQDKLVKDRLLSFLDDFRIRRGILLNKDRRALLMEVRMWCHVMKFNKVFKA